MAETDPTPPETPPNEASDKQQFAYIADMCSELSRLAGRPRFRTVNYLLDMARLEAERMVKDAPS